MRGVSIATLASPATIALLVACATDPNPAAPRLQAMSFANSEWSEPENLGAPVNSAAGDMNPALSPDELSLYFVSTRAGGFGGADIWVARRASLDSPWEEPVNLGPGVNGPGIEGSPSISIDGHLLFFSSDRPGGQGSNDIYVARRADKSDDLSWGPGRISAPTSTPRTSKRARSICKAGKTDPRTCTSRAGPIPSPWISTMRR